jgi:hypothetical protein
VIETLLAERAATGESYRALEERSGIRAATLAWWQKRLRDESAQPEPIELIEVEAPRGWATPSIEIALPSGVTVRVPVSVGVDLIGQILDLVSQRC